MAATLSHRLAGVGRWLRKELVAAWPLFLFFLAGFLILITLIKLALAQFSIEMTVLSKAVVGALFAAKAALILDDTPLARNLEHYRRIVAVAAKTLLYGVGFGLLAYLERFLEALHKVHSFDGAIRYVIDHANHNRIVAWALGVSTVFALYFTFFEISENMGKGALWNLFFESPRTPNGAGRLSNISAADKRRN
jgi:hypothetical protein